jgi:exonuclease SbcC
MNLKSNELLIDFIFETGKTQNAYRATVRGKRNSKRFSDVKALDRSVYKKNENNWIPIEYSELESAIGLSYENFKRTIIIPQGQFQEFLQLGNKDRTQMLKELFNLEKFELFYKVASLESKNNQQIQNIKGQLQQLGEIDPEQIKEKENLLLQLKNDLDGLEEKIKIQQQKEAQFQQLLELNKKLEAVKSEYKTLQNQEPDFIQLEKTTQQYEKCTLYFKNLLDTFEISTKKITEKNEQIETDNQKLLKVENEIGKVEASFKKIKSAYDNRESLKQRAQELEKITKINSLNKSVQN